MSYRSQLTLWIIVKLMPNLQNVIVGRFRSKSDADGHLKVLNRMIPQAKFVVMFDPLPIQQRRTRKTQKKTPKASVNSY